MQRKSPSSVGIDDSVYRFLVDWTALRGEVGLAFRAGSPGANEQASYQRPESILTAFSIASAAIESAHDHLWAVARLVSNGDSAMAPWTCARATIEAAAIAKWLAAPDASAAERVKRSLSLRYQSIKEQQKVARGRGEAEQVARAEARIEALEKIATELAFSPVRDRNGSRIGVGHAPPSITDLISTELGDGELYRLLCGMAHSDYVMLRRLGMRTVDYNDDGLVVERSPSESLRDDLVPAAVGAFAKAAWAYAGYIGVDQTCLQLILERCYDDLNQPSDAAVRFWRTTA